MVLFFEERDVLILVGMGTLAKTEGGIFLGWSRGLEAVSLFSKSWGIG